MDRLAQNCGTTSYYIWEVPRVNIDRAKVFSRFVAQLITLDVRGIPAYLLFAGGPHI